MKKLYHTFRIIPLFLIVLLSVFLTQNAETETSIYHNSENHFSFKIPDGWMQAPQHVLDEYIKTLKQQAKEAGAPLSKAFIAVAIFQLKKSTDLTDPKSPSFRIGIDHVGRISESELKKLIASGEMKEPLDQGISEAKRILPIITNIKINEPIYDDKRKLILLKGITSASDIGKRAFLVTQFLTSNGTINIAFNSPEDDFQNYIPAFSEVINSFKFDPGFEYK